jgi:probable phosphoglycerate mutase
MSDPTSEKTVYFLRHGQSEANTAPVFQPLDSPLTALGKEQAENIANRIAKISFETLITSPLPRAQETANAIAALTGKQPESSELFVERIKPTGLGGKLHADTIANKVWQEWNESLYTPGMRVEDGENFDDLIARADAALAFLKNRKEKTMVVVTHGWFLRTMIIRAVLGDALTSEAFRNFQMRITMENTGLSVLKYNDGREGASWRLWIYNDHAHLG